MRAAAAVMLVACACGSEVRLGHRQGIAKIIGELHGDVGWFRCGDAAANELVSIASTVEGEACRIIIRHRVELGANGELDPIRDTAKQLEGIELDIRELWVRDDDSGALLLEDPRLTDASLTVNETLLLTRPEMRELPRTVALLDVDVERVKRALAADVTVNLVVIVMLVTTVAEPLPRNVGVKWEVQPTLVLQIH